MYIPKISDKGLSIEKHFESLHDGDLSVIGLQPKRDPIGIWTVGYGHALRDPKTGKFLTTQADKCLAYQMFPAMTVQEACDLLDLDNRYFESWVYKIAKQNKLALKPFEWDALVSFCMNLGPGNLQKSTLLKRIINHDTPERIREAFGRFNKAKVNGVYVPLPGLTRRRKSEAELFLNNNVNFFLK